MTAALVLPHTDFVLGERAAASEIDANFAEIVRYSNKYLIHRDGSKAFTEIPSGVTPVADADLVTKGYADGVRDARCPIGSTVACRATYTGTLVLAAGGSDSICPLTTMVENYQNLIVVSGQPNTNFATPGTSNLGLYAMAAAVRSSTAGAYTVRLSENSNTFGFTSPVCTTAGVWMSSGYMAYRTTGYSLQNIWVGITNSDGSLGATYDIIFSIVRLSD